METKRGMSRRGFLKTASGLALAPTVPLLASREAMAADDLVVGTWGGDYENLLQKFIAPVVQKEGISVEYATSDAVPRLTALKAERHSRRGSMDVALLADLDMYDAYNSGTIFEVSEKLIPNLSNVYEQFHTPYSIPHIFSAMVIVYNTEKIATAPDSFTAALDPKYKGRTGFSDILYYSNGLFCDLAGGGQAHSYESGKKFLMELRGNAPKVYPSNEMMAAAFKSGEIWMACMWKARALQWRDAGLPLGFVIPKEGAIPVTFEGTVAKNARNAKDGWKYLDAMLEPSGQQGFATAMGYAPTVRNAGLTADQQARVGFTDAELSRIKTLDRKALFTQKNDFLTFWNEQFKAGLS